jgi:hypothetical protein
MAMMNINYKSYFNKVTNQSLREKHSKRSVECFSKQSQAESEQIGSLDSSGPNRTPSGRSILLAMTARLSVVVPIVLLLLSSGSAFGQTMITAGQAGVQRVFADNYMGVGFSASFVSGVALTLKDHLPYSPIAIQITGMPFKDGNVGMYDIGGELQYDLFLGVTRLYLVAGGGYYYYNDGSNGDNSNRYGSNINNSNTSNSSGNELNSPYRLGFGLGYEIPYGRNIGMTLNLMFTAFMPSGDILPTPSIGFVGYFR